MLLPAMQEMQETWVQSLDGEDPLEKEMSTHSCCSCLKNSMDRGAWRATACGVKKRGRRQSGERDAFKSKSDVVPVTSKAMAGNQCLRASDSADPLHLILKGQHHYAPMPH